MQALSLRMLEDTGSFVHGALVILLALDQADQLLPLGVVRLSLLSILGMTLRRQSALQLIKKAYLNSIPLTLAPPKFIQPEKSTLLVA